LPLAPVVVDEATRLRQRGATVVVVVAHAGAQCRHLGRPTDLRGCDRLAPAYRLAQALPAGLVDVIVAGDTHQAISHLVNGTAIIQSFSNGRAFGRVDVKLDGAGRRRGLHIWAPRLLCSGEESPGPGAGACRGFYEGGVVKADPALAADLAEIDKRARAKREVPLNVVASAPFYRVHGKEGPLGNLIADLFLVAVPRVDLAIVNSGGLRDDLPRGHLQYGDLFRILPFDNLFATVTLSAGQLEDVLARHLGRAGSLISVAGVRVRGRCRAGKVGVQILRDDGRPILPDEPLTVVTSDYLANGGDDFFDRPGQTAHLGPPIRQALAELLSQQGGTLRPGSHHDPRRPRLAFPGLRPVRCDRPRTRHR